MKRSFLGDHSSVYSVPSIRTLPASSVALTAERLAAGTGSAQVFASSNQLTVEPARAVLCRKDLRSIFDFDIGSPQLTGALISFPAEYLFVVNFTSTGLRIEGHGALLFVVDLCSSGLDLDFQPFHQAILAAFSEWNCQAS